MKSTLTELGREAVGRRQDWNLRVPKAPQLRPAVAWLGPAAMIASLAISWSAFAGATGEDGSVAFGLFIGAASIVLMAWSFLLSVRFRFLEPLFGGLDRAYQAHRWAGTLAVVAMFLHTSAEPEIEGNGIRGASKSLAESAEGLASTGEVMLYILVAISLLRWFPFRWWRWTHKLLGIPFAFACFHFYTAEKPYANGSAWGWYFATIMVVGLAAYVLRVGVRDALTRGVRYRVSGLTRVGPTTEIRLAPTGRPLQHEAGQFGVLKLQARGLSEPHVFTIASSPEADELRFFIRDLGDWTERIQSADLIGTEAYVEGPYGTFEPHGRSGQRTVWVAGGVGITPFLSAIDSASPSDEPPVLVYCVRDRADSTAIHELEQAAADGRIDLHVFASGEGRRFAAAELDAVAGPIDGAHVAVCGPTGLVGDVVAAARRAGAAGIESELFDIRGGFGPDLSRSLANLVSR